MEQSVRKDQDKKKVYEVTTFPVPVTLGKNRENISIITNTTTKLSKEQMLNQAFKFQREGNLLEAAKYYQHFIDQGFNDHRVYTNYGGVLQSLGQLKEAELYTRKAIQMNPDHANALANLGVILKNLGKLKEAELYTRKAIQINPNLAIAYSNLGDILLDRGQLKEAELYTRKAIQINPNLAIAYLNLGSILKNLGKSQESLNLYLKVIDIDPKCSHIDNSIAILLEDSDLSLFNRGTLKNTLKLLLEKNNISHKKLFKVFNFLYSNEIISNLEKSESLATNTNIINAFEKIIFKNIRLEKQLTKLRKRICNKVSLNKEKIDYPELQLVIALAKQCFLNEYVYSLTEKEIILTKTIIDRCKNGEINVSNILILSCYFPLYKLLDQIPLLKFFNYDNQSFNDLIKIQISEPLIEKELSKSIKKLGKINNHISQKVQSQYEENPYPRWRYSSINEKISIIKAINSDIKPNSITNNLQNQELKVLIAGCGTGQQIINSHQYQNTKITAIDLSLSSLSYAQRKINELNINNVKLIQMDILEVNLLEEKFDIIECGGVLHHMDNPTEGLKALLRILKRTGFIKLGLYSELARQDIVKARKYISNNKLKPNEDNIRDFRQKVISDELSTLNSLKEIGDFYSLSQCRDLCFHAKEHRFTINQLQETLKSNELEFMGFILPQSIKSIYKSYFPQDKTQTNLKNWAKFEEKHPYTFRRMYQFWICKAKI